MSRTARKSMTWQSFLRHLRNTRDMCLWWQNCTGAIASNTQRCPITAVCWNLTDFSWSMLRFENAAKDIKLPLRLARQIAIASDNGPRHNKRIRAALLRATGLA